MLLLLWIMSRDANGDGAYGASAADARIPGPLLLLHRIRRCTGWCGALVPLAAACRDNADRLTGRRVGARTGLSGPAGDWLELGPGGCCLGSGLCPSCFAQDVPWDGRRLGGACPLRVSPSTLSQLDGPCLLQRPSGSGAGRLPVVLLVT